MNLALIITMNGEGTLFYMLLRRQLHMCQYSTYNDFSDVQMVKFSIIALLL